ncbi:MAG TPA: PQQ-binding-like beta-propeller repeat protein [Bryobacteraceae bacterium]|nr:PQQ-binding-like beta-propeller repeat protein [Bryobacteraceae bacterium]
MKAILANGFLLLITSSICCAAATVPQVGDWPDWRGPNRDGISREKHLPEKWSLAGENLSWKAPYGGRSAPIILGDRLYLENSAGKGETQQERVMCFNADTGKLLWEYKFNIFQSDVPPHRVGWASPAADVETGNVYAFGVGGTLVALTRDGKLLWSRSLGEELDLFTTHGGRTTSPVVDGNLVIVKAASSTWGTQANRSIRAMALDKRTGETVWVSTPGGRPFDTDYSQPIVARINGTKLLITGLGDGGVHAIKIATGEPVWHFVLSKRAINTAPVLDGTTVIVSHGQENLEGNEMGMLAAIDATAKGNIAVSQAKWTVKGFIGEFSSGVLDGDRYLQVDNGANLHAFDPVTGRELWKQNLGTVQKASPVFGDGKIYVGTETGKFYILRPHADRCEILSAVEMPINETGIYNERVPAPVVASAAISRGRVYFVSSDTLYAIGKKTRVPAEPAVEETPAPAPGQPAYVQVVPTEVTMIAGQTANFRARLFDEHGEFLREEKANWSLAGLKGSIDDGKFTPADHEGQAGLIKATAGGISGEARVRVVPPLPWNETFDAYAVGATPSYWLGAAAGQYKIAELDGGKVLAKAPNQTLFKRMRVFLGPTDWSNYTVEADVRVPEKRRQMGDAGVTAQRYTLVLFGNNQQLELYSWQPQTASNFAVPFSWKPDTWYHLKLRVENEAGGKTRIQGKAWPAAESEPAGWLIDHVDPIPNREGSPGLFGDSTYGVFFDNLKVTANQ